MKSTKISKKDRSKPSTRKTPPPEVRVPLRYAYLLFAIILLLPIIFIGIQDLSARSWDWYAAIVQGGYAVAYALIAPALILLAKGKQLNNWLRTLCNILIVATILVLAWLVIGFLEDLIGLRCQGFFGVQTSCMEGQYLSLLIWTINPYVTLSTVGLILLASAKGWFDYSYYKLQR